jgi:hypothetical protein
MTRKYFRLRRNVPSPISDRDPVGSKHGTCRPGYALFCSCIIGALSCGSCSRPPAETRVNVSRLEETAALDRVRLIMFAQHLYLLHHGDFATSLAELGPNGDGLISADLASGHIANYTFSMTPDAFFAAHPNRQSGTYFYAHPITMSITSAPFEDPTKSVVMPPQIKLLRPFDTPEARLKYLSSVTEKAKAAVVENPFSPSQRSRLLQLLDTPGELNADEAAELQSLAKLAVGAPEEALSGISRHNAFRWSIVRMQALAETIGSWKVQTKPRTRKR